MGNLVFQATLGGQVNLVGPNTASTYNINVPAVAGNMVTTGDTGTVTSTMLASSVYTAPGTIGSGTPNTGAFTTLTLTNALGVAYGGTNATSFTGKSGNVAGLVFYDGTKLTNDATVTDVGYDTSTNTVKANNLSISGTQTYADGSTQNTAATGFGFKNRIINGAMMIDQRNAGASVTNGAGYLFSVDRWITYGSQASKFSVQQVNSPVTGFSKAMKFTSLSAYSVAAGDLFFTVHWIEGLNVQDLGWGTANAQAVTISFKVYSSLTGTFGGVVKNGASNRSYPFTFTVNTANTEEVKTITIPGDTAGTWATDNGKGIGLLFGLGVGSTYLGAAGAWASTDYYSATGATSVVGTNGATFYITGVQLEKGSTATSFDYRPYGTELALCQRYCIRYGGVAAYEPLGMAIASGTTTFQVPFQLPVEMRSAPTLSYSSASNWAYSDVNTGGNSTGTAIAINVASTKVVDLNFSGLSGLTTYRPNMCVANNTTSASLTLSAEL